MVQRKFKGEGIVFLTKDVAPIGHPHTKEFPLRNNQLKIDHRHEYKRLS